VCLHACGVFAHVWCVEADLEFFLKGIVLERGEGGTLMNNTQHVQIVLHRIEALCTSVEAVMQATKSTKKAIITIIKINFSVVRKSSCGSFAHSTAC